MSSSILEKIEGEISNLRYEKKNYRNSRRFFCLVSNKNKIYDVVVEANVFLPLWNFDVIRTNLKENSDGTYSLDEFPFVIISNKTPQLTECVKKCSYGLGLKNLKTNEGNFLYEFDTKEVKDRFKNVGLYLDYLASRVYYAKIKEDCTCELPSSSYITKTKTFEIFLGRWLKERVFRQLYLLTLTKTQINSLAKKMELLKIFDEIIINPYKVVHIPIENCDKIVMQTLGYINPDHKKGGIILRSLYEKQNTQSWSYVPERFFLKEFPELPSLRQFLTDEFYLVFDEGKVYSQISYEAETKTAAFLTELMAKEKPEFNPEIIKFSPNLSYEQKEVVINCLKERVSIASGGPGTGKSTISAEIVNYLEDIEEKFAICAFTGNATKRIRQCILDKVKDKKYVSDRISTLDKLIVRAGEKKINISTLIIDEISMVTTELFHRTLEALNYKIERVIFIGDVDQLPPISWGYLLESCLKTAIPVFYLFHCYRTISVDNSDEIHPIVFNSQILLEFGKKRMKPCFQKSNYFLLKEGNYYDVEKTVKNFYQAGVDIEQFRIICPVNSHLKKLNLIVNSIYFSSQDNIKDKWDNTWILNSLVMARENFYGREYQFANGEEGRIVSIGIDEVEDKKSSKFIAYSYIEVKFPDIKDTIKFYTQGIEIPDKREVVHFSSSLMPASAKTVHKTQGSEYDFIIYYFPETRFTDSKSSFYNYRLNYTAVTRAKKAVRIIGHLNSFYISCTKLPYIVYEELHKRLPQKSKIEESENEDEGEFNDQEYYFETDDLDQYMYE